MPKPKYKNVRQEFRKMGLDLRSERGKLTVSRAVVLNGVPTRKEYFAGDNLEEVETFRVTLGERLTAQVLARIRTGLPVPQDTEPKVTPKAPAKKAVKKKAAKKRKVVKKKPAKKKSTK